MPASLFVVIEDYRDLFDHLPNAIGKNFTVRAMAISLEKAVAIGESMASTNIFDSNSRVIIEEVPGDWELELNAFGRSTCLNGVIATYNSKGERK